MQGCLGMVTSSAAGYTPQGSLDQPAPLRHGTWTTQNWLLWRYQNFDLLTDTSPSSIWGALVGLCLSPCHILSVHDFLGKSNVNTLYLFHHMSTKHHSFWHWGEFPQCSPYGGFLDGRVDQILFGPIAAAPPQKIIQKEWPP